MRQLIESLSPEANRIHWKWIGGVFAFYVAVMAGATVVFTTHQSAKRFTTQATAASATAQGTQRTVDAAAMPRSQMVIDH